MLTREPALRTQDETGLRATDLERPRLTQAVLGTGPGGLCLVVAPQGYGATTCVARALAEEASTHWCGLERVEQEDLAASLALCLAVETAGPGVLDRVLAALDGGAADWLVLDGVSHDVTGPNSWDVVETLAQRLPLTCRLVVIAAQAPPSDVLSLAARSGSRLLTADDLRCTDDEALALVQRAAPDIDIDAARAISNAAQGWIEAITAAAAQARSGQPSPTWLLTAGPHALFDQRLSHLPRHVVDFLVATAELDLLSADLAAAVSGREDAAELLLWLDNRLLFICDAVAPAGQSGRWWRRHPLLTAALRNRVGAGRTEQHSRAADWFAATGDITSALAHLTAAGRAADASRMLAEHESKLLADGRAEEVLDWYRRMPEQWNSEGLNLLRLAWGQVLSRDNDTANVTLARLEAHLALRPATDRPEPGLPHYTVDLQAEKDLLAAYLAGLRADPATMITASRAADDLLLANPERAGSQLAPLLTIRGMLWSGRTSTALATSEAVLVRVFADESMRECHRPAAHSLALSAAGSIREAKVHAHRASAWLTSQGLDPMDNQFSVVPAAQARVLLESAELAAAVTVARDLSSAAQRQGHRGQQVEALLLLATAATVADNLSEAVRVLDEAREVAMSACPGSQMRALIDEQLARVRLAAGDTVRAQRLAQSLPSQAARTLMTGRVLVATQPVAVVRSVEALQPATPRIAVDRHLLLATAHARASRRVAQAHLRQGAQLAWEHGLALALTGADANLSALAHATASETQDDAVAWLLQRAAGEGGTNEGRTMETPLSRGELHLLSLLPRRPRYSELAEELGISVNTVKTRLRKLYAKLGAAGRDDAVAQARHRGLLPPR